MDVPIRWEWKYKVQALFMMDIFLSAWKCEVLLMSFEIACFDGNFESKSWVCFSLRPYVDLWRPVSLKFWINSGETCSMFTFAKWWKHCSLTGFSSKLRSKSTNLILLSLYIILRNSSKQFFDNEPWNYCVSGQGTHFSSNSLLVEKSKLSVRFSRHVLISVSSEMLILFGFPCEE